MSDTPQEEVILNWILVKPNYSVRCMPLPMSISRKLYEGLASHCRSTFRDNLFSEYEISVAVANMLLWMPKEPLRTDAARELRWGRWATTLVDFGAHFRTISYTDSLADQGLGIENSKLVHVVITIENMPLGEQMDIDTFPELREFTRYKNTVQTPGPTPSNGAKSTAYRLVQGDPTQAIYDGRRALAKSNFTIAQPPLTIERPPLTIAPPIHIFHPIFNGFVHRVLSPDTQPTVDDLKATQGFMDALSVVGRAEDGSAGYNYTACRALAPILRAKITHAPNPDGTKPDGVVTLDVGDTWISFVLIEFKREIGDGGCDPTTQAGLSMKRSWIDQNRNFVRERCCCPTFLIGGCGPWLCVLGGIFTDKFIVQRLTDLRWMGVSSTEEDFRVYQNARVLVALRECIEQLKQFYLDLPSVPSLAANQPHPRYFPYPTSFMDENGNKICFQYLKSLEDDPTCVTFLAEIVSTSVKIVVKFVGRYGKEAHNFLARHNLAPTLQYYGPLPDTNTSDFTSGVVSNAPPGLFLSSHTMSMVVMDYIESRPNPPPDGYHQIRSALLSLHSAGYVFGDLRTQNILFDTDGGLKLIDFNWCGRFDMGIRDPELPEGVQEAIDANRDGVQDDVGSGEAYAYYPLSMSTLANMWAPGMEPLVPIRPQHDWHMFARLQW